MLTPQDDGGAGQLLVVSNRGPYALKETAAGLVPQRTVGGLVAAVEPVLEQCGGTWLSWQGRLSGSDSDPVSLPGRGYRCAEVRLTEPEYHHYYAGFANGCLWPLLHNFIAKCHFHPEEWQTYGAVNARFARQAAALAAPGSLIWVHDFHLSLVPALLRERLGEAPIALFWHVPFPPPEIFEALPWGREILCGMLGSDQVAFHVQAYARNFLRCVQELLGAPVDPVAGTVDWRGRRVRVRTLPLGVDVAAFRTLAARPAVQRQAEALREAIGVPTLLLGIDRMDYTKGIPERLEAFEHLLDTAPQLRGQVVLVQVGVPSRGDVQGYQGLRQRVEALVGRINGRFGDGRYQPVLYSTRPLAREEVVAHYLAADAILVTPLRDGLNLVAKEYVSSRLDGRGALVLSRFAGAAVELPEALQVNPYHKEALAAAIHEALVMPAGEQQRRLAAMQARLAQRDLTWWWQQVQADLQSLRPAPLEQMAR